MKKQKIHQINADMAVDALGAIQDLLDSGGIPRGTFADEQVQNLVALYNQRGDEIERLGKALTRNAEETARMIMVHEKYTEDARAEIKRLRVVIHHFLTTYEGLEAVIALHPDTAFSCNEWSAAIDRLGACIDWASNKQDPERGPGGPE